MKNTILTALKPLSILAALLLVFSASCSDGSSTTEEITPSNLVLRADIGGKTALKPNGDGSGMVNFVITANNATTYKISFGDGITQDAISGTNSYKYKTVGTNNYEVTVTAYNGSKSTSTSITITVFVTTGAIWSDEFDTNGSPDAANWSYDIGDGCNVNLCGWGNNEKQYYTSRPENVIVQGGFLKIIAKKENYLGSSYTSARLLTKGKFAFKYGRVEMRAKLPVGAGTWPALWMLGSNIDTAVWPACGEIDIMEHSYLNNQLNTIGAALHYPGRSGLTGNPDFSTVKPNNTATTEFHIYSMDWRADAIKFYVDGQLFKTFVNSASVPFNQNFFLLINCAMGGNNGGVIDPNFVSATYEIDYVRVFN